MVYRPFRRSKKQGRFVTLDDERVVFIRGPGQGAGSVASRGPEGQEVLTVEQVIDLAKDTDLWRKHGENIAGVENPRGFAGRDPLLANIMDARGFGIKPQVVSPEEFDKLTNSEERMYRGIAGAKYTPADELCEQFRSGSYWIGQGIMGNGTYVALDPGAGDMVSRYAGWDGRVLRMALDKEAKVTGYDDIRSVVTAVMNHLYYQSQEVGHSADYQRERENHNLRAFLNSASRMAVLLGFDAILAKGAGQAVILNRGKVIVDERDYGPYHF